MKHNKRSMAVAAIGAGGLAAAMTTPALGVNRSTASGSTVKIVSATIGG